MFDTFNVMPGSDIQLEEREIMSKLNVCLRHISEVFLYEYYCLGDDEYEISEEGTSPVAILSCIINERSV